MVDTVLHCDCGFEASGADEDELVAVVQRHSWEVHGMALSHEEALLLAFRAELRETSRPQFLLGDRQREGRREQSC